MNKPIVASLCGGTESLWLSCGDAGIDVFCEASTYEYHSFETDKYAEAVAKYNIPHIKQHGDVRNWTKLKGRDVFLLVAGFPCQPYSVAGRMKGTSDSRDLSEVMYDALEGLNPKYYLFENVVSNARHTWYDFIRGIRPDAEMYIHDSADLSAQSRKRVYITNIPHDKLVEQGIVLQDVLEDDSMSDRDKSYCIDANYFKGGSMKMYFEKSRRQLVFNKKGCHQVGEADLKGYDIIKRVYSRQGKSPALTTMQGGWRQPKVETDELHWRALTPLECERLQTYPDGWTKYGIFDDKQTREDVLLVEGISNSQRYKMIGNGFTRAVISHILEGVYS